ncbi:hypothetical protein CBOM_07691 [Ceraceosorus bombacis]|uniref:Uncharacterized protein n=1 Tax=Ceraceosorus bombacis TaxID=401625 RepID=A0A0P1BNF3_9BASI|nr:hypothetical protein CBOM_07691 [Ceraceosorus bombacis]
MYDTLQHLAMSRPSEIHTTTSLLFPYESLNNLAGYCETLTSYEPASPAPLPKHLSSRSPPLTFVSQASFDSTASTVGLLGQTHPVYTPTTY